MVARKRTLNLGVAVSSPLLIPSVSSKGFPTYEDGISEASEMASFVAPSMHEAMLISAYDLEHGYLVDGPKLRDADRPKTIYNLPKLLVVDSGGYEMAQEFESGFINRTDASPKPFDEEAHAALIDDLDPDRPTLVVSYDRPHDERGSFADQRKYAQAFFAERPHLQSDFLLKPEPDDRFVQMKRLASEVDNLRAFDVIGVTEKELGGTILDRLVNLRALRSLLDEAQVESPIHVFGALDPLLTPLYFMSGGEIFDGLSWMRYAYLDGMAVHPDAYAVTSGHVDHSEGRRDQTRHMFNIAELERMKRRLERWFHEPLRFDVLGPQHEAIREIYETVQAQQRRK